MAAELPSPSTTDREGLPQLEASLLWGMRAWVAGQRQGRPAIAAISFVFRGQGAPEATGFLDGLMWVVAHGARRSLAVHCPCCADVSSDEEALLDALALTQERDSFGRLVLLRTLLQPRAAIAAGRSATGLVDSVNRAGLFFDVPNPPRSSADLPARLGAHRRG